MMKRSLLGLAAAAAMGLAALAGGTGEAQAGVNVHIGVPFPGVYVAPPAPVYYGGVWYPSFYYGATAHPRFYYHPKAPYHCHKWGHRNRKCHRHW
jgi:hypothetical protein